MENEQDSAVEIGPEDIIFNCPKCGKSLTIDVRGAVPCPDCGTQVMVPSGENAADSDAEGDLSPEEMHQSLATLVDRIHELEKLRALDMVRREKVSEQVALIQAAIDRIVSIVQDAQAAAAQGDADDVDEG